MIKEYLAYNKKSGQIKENINKYEIPTNHNFDKNNDKFDLERGGYKNLNRASIKTKELKEGSDINKSNLGDKNYLQLSPLDFDKINIIKNNVVELETDKLNLENEIIELRKHLKNIKKEDYIKKISILEQEKEEAKKSANHYITLCSQLAEEVIVLRNKLDNYSHFKKEKENF